MKLKNNEEFDLARLQYSIIEENLEKLDDLFDEIELSEELSEEELNKKIKESIGITEKLIEFSNLIKTKLTQQL